MFKYAKYTFKYAHIFNFKMCSFMSQVAVRAIAAKLWEIKDTYNTKVFA